ncbi:MAG: DNA cytosine methyltransferase [Alphaproteobacteria bacterium]|nr:DNA cytosine methyltransferase [Alphaproteobacteria bacterium]
MTGNGSLSILAGYYPKIESGFTLSALLEDKPDAKYFLSSTAVSRILGYKDNELAALQQDISSQPAAERILLNVNSIKKATMKNPQGTRINTIDGNSVALQSCAGGMGAKTGLYCVPRGKRDGGFKDGDTCPTITANAFQQNNFIVPVLTPDRVNKRQNGRRFKEAGEPSFTLTTQDRHGIYDGIDIRRLTPLECERLQGFPDGWTETGENGQRMSDTARYKALGNAVSVCFPELIAKSLFMENEMTADVIQFPQKKKENLNAVYVLLDTVRKMHDEDGYRFASSELKENSQGKVVLTLVMDKPDPDDLPDITA